jgi:hypothetical protein
LAEVSGGGGGGSGPAAQAAAAALAGRLHLYFVEFNKIIVCFIRNGAETRPWC